ncbi:GtrA family protein [Pendulispora albinea]|uniref:GtrA family protein n=1 Tax=Pendulispora albinea TaxID=2741071 RepID=A0ABZ2LKI7_9BACT
MSPAGPSDKLRSQAGELARFVVVGGSAVSVDFLVYFAMVHFVPLVPVGISKATSFIAGACLAFVLNRGFVFRAGERKAREQLLPFALLYLVSLGLNNLVNTLLLGYGAVKLVAWFFATGTSTVSNFLGMKFIVFRRKAGASST